MEFFNEIWLKVEEHEYIYIFEIQFERKKKICLKMADKTSFVTLCNNANLTLAWKRRNRYDFFLLPKDTQLMFGWFVGKCLISGFFF